MLFLKFVHVALMFGAVTLVVGSIVFLDLVGRSRDVLAYRRLDAIVQRTDLVALVLFIAGIAVGFLTALAGGFDLTASWLIVAYVLVGALVIESVVFTLPWYGRIRAAASHTDEGQAATELRRLLNTPHHLLLVTAIVALWAALIFVMIVKPDFF